MLSHAKKFLMVVFWLMSLWCVGLTRVTLVHWRLWVRVWVYSACWKTPSLWNTSR